MLPWLVEIGIITSAAVAPKSWSLVGLPVPKGSYPKVGTFFPAPSCFVATAILFGPLALLSDTNKVGPMASLVAWGLVLATFLNLLDPTDPLNPNTPGAVVNPSLLYPQGTTISGPVKGNP